MAFDATAFRNQLAYGGARPNLYEVHVTFPSEDVSVSEKFTFMCRSASLPGMMVGTATLPYFGRTIKLVGDRQFDDWNVQIINDEDFKVRNAFEAWQNKMDLLDHGTDAKESMCENNQSVNKYYAEIEVVQLTKDGGKCGHGDGTAKKYILKNAWPNQIGPIELAWDANDQIEQFMVNFTYDYFITDKIEGFTADI